jgi:hypothetical protein
VKGDRGHGPGHDGETDAGPEPVRRRQDRILSEEGHVDPGPASGQVDLSQQRVERSQVIESGGSGMGHRWRCIVR